MKRFKKISIKIICLIQIIMCTLSPLTVIARTPIETPTDTQTLIGNKIRSYAVDFVNKANAIKSGFITEFNTGQSYGVNSLETKDLQQLVLYCRNNRQKRNRIFYGNKRRFD